jgi:hypothetical protein
MATLLREVAVKRGIDVRPFIANDGSWRITDSDRQILIEAISDEFSATGLRSDSEPNQRGLQLEELLDQINKFS